MGGLDKWSRDSLGKDIRLGEVVERHPRDHAGTRAQDGFRTVSVVHWNRLLNAGAPGTPGCAATQSVRQASVHRLGLVGLEGPQRH
jgi:hypothetical protein